VSGARGQLDLLADAVPELLLDLDVDGADRLLAAMLDAALAASSTPAPCGCLPGPLVLDAENGEAPRCSRCGREPAP
jgi:hypothetical protein